MNIAQQIRWARVRQGLTQKQAAERWGVSLICVAKWEGGENYPRGATMEKWWDEWFGEVAPSQAEQLRALVRGDANPTTGRPAKWTDEQVLALVPRVAEGGNSRFMHLARLAREKYEMSKATLAGRLKGLSGRGLVAKTNTGWRRVKG